METVKDCIKKYKDLIDYFVLQYDNGQEFEILSEDAEFMDEEILELEVQYCRCFFDEYCIIYLN